MMHKFTSKNIFSFFSASQHAEISKNNRKLLLLELGWGKPDSSVAIGHTSILTNLRKHKIDVLAKTWHINSSCFSTKKVLDFIFENSSDNCSDIGIGVYIWNEKHIQAILKELRCSGFSGRIILGGPQITYTKNNLEFLYPTADVFIRGYAENSLVELFNTEKQRLEIPGIHYAGFNDNNTLSSVDLKTLSSPIVSGMLQPSSDIRWETKRGCVYTCAFCQYKSPSTSARHVDAFPIQRIFSELQWLIKNQSTIERLVLVDSCFNYGEDYLSILRYLIDHRASMQIDLECRIELVSPMFLELVEQLNKTSSVILQFGLQTIIPAEELIINRINHKKKLVDVLNAVNKRKIISEISLIYGLPFQTKDSFLQSISFCQAHGAPIIKAFPLMLLRGAELYNRQDELNLIVSIENENKFPYVVSSPSFTYHNWLQMKKIADTLDLYNQPMEHEIRAKRTAIVAKYQRSNASIFTHKNDDQKTIPSAPSQLRKPGV